MAKNKPLKNSDSTLPQLVGLILILAALVAFSTVGTLIALGVIKTGEDPVPVGSVVEADGVCTQQVRSDYGDDLNAITVDDRSSRFDSSAGEYKVFYQLDIYREKNHQSGVQVFYVSCYVSAKKGDISRIEYLEQVEFKPKAIRRTHGNAFGF